MLGLTDPVPDLLAKGQSLQDENKFKNNVVHIASFANQHEFLDSLPKDLLDRVKDSQNANNETPILVAIKEFSKESVDFWLKNDVDTRITDKNGDDAHSLAEKTGQTWLLKKIESHEEAVALR
jgi:ankyrin repeat protein